MRGETTLTGKAQFALVYEKGRSRAAREMVVKAFPNGLDFNRYGVTVSRRVGKAVVRNRVKRRLREIIRQINPPPGWDIIIVARNPAAGADFKTMRRTAEQLMLKAGLVAGEHESARPGVD